MKKVIVTGASGMVGEGVLMECLENAAISEVLVIGRRSCKHTHPKLTEILIPDFFDLAPLNGRLSGYDACYFCLGVSSLGMKEPEYYRLTYTLTLGFAQKLVTESPDAVFCYVSGAGTDSTENGRLMWARVKGKTENDLMKLPFKAVFAFRPGFMKATKGQKNLPKFYNLVNWLYPALKAIIPNMISTLKQVGEAMIRVTLAPEASHAVEVPEIKALAAE
ncbi:MAG: epimerase [Mucilaginibacter polytrichastri]|nr:epimerase [Mucilaginibacter polytrichastri]